MSQQERISWVALVINVVVSGLYFYGVFRMPGDSALLGPGMAIFIGPLILFAIVVAIVCEIVLRLVQKRGGDDPSRVEQLDERDRLISLRAGHNAYAVLVIGIAVVIGHIAATQWMSALWHASNAPTRTVLLRLAVGPLNGPLIAQLLLLALTLASWCKYGTRIVSYRRGY
jgi:uncharacterized membrane protein